MKYFWKLFTLVIVTAVAISTMVACNVSINASIPDEPTTIDTTPDQSTTTDQTPTADKPVEQTPEPSQDPVQQDPTPEPKPEPKPDPDPTPNQKPDQDSDPDSEPEKEPEQDPDPDPEPLAFTFNSDNLKGTVWVDKTAGDHNGYRIYFDTTKKQYIIKDKNGNAIDKERTWLINSGILRLYLSNGGNAEFTYDEATQTLSTTDASFNFTFTLEALSY